MEKRVVTFRRASWAVFWALAAAVGVQSAYGQGTPPPPPPPGAALTPTGIVSPTPTSTPALPKGALLLKKMKAAEKKAGSYHFVLTMQIRQPKMRLYTVLEHGDVSLRHHRQHTFFTNKITNQHGHSTVSRSESISAGNLFASRARGGKWDCLDLSKKPRGGFGFGVTEPEVTLVGMPPHLRQIKTVGQVLIGGLLDWRVHATSARYQTYNSYGVHLTFSQKGTYDFFISQIDDSLRRQVSSEVVRFENVLHLRSIEDRSSYGKHFHITLPCSRYDAPLREDYSRLPSSLTRAPR